MTTQPSPPRFQLLSQGAVNLAGQIAPLFVAIITIPLLLGGLGTERFGFLSLGWLIVGYFSIFDLGLGRALTQMVASRLSSDANDLRSLIRSGLIAMSVLGVFAAILAAALTPTLVHSVFHVSPAIVDEALIAFYMLALTIPVVILSTGLTGILTAYGRFGLINWVRIPLGVSGYLLPVAVLGWTQDLSVIVAFLCLSRMVAMLGLWIMCRRTTEHLPGHTEFNRTQLATLFRFGGWMTATNIVGPVMTYMDRFLVGSVVSVAAIAYYATPFQIISKLVMVPSAIAGVLFPAFAMVLGGNDSPTSESAMCVRNAELSSLVDRGWRYIGLSLFPVVLTLVCFGHEGLHFWLGQEFAENGTGVLQWLAIGVFANAIAYVPFTLIQSAGRADLAAILNLVELPLYLVALFAALHDMGILGAAAVWAMRFAIDCACLLLIAARVAPAARMALVRAALFALAGCIVLLASMTLGPLTLRIAAYAAVLVIGTGTAFHFHLIPPLRGIRRALGSAGNVT